jgi:hypothetical protein
VIEKDKNPIGLDLLFESKLRLKQNQRLSQKRLTGIKCDREG